MATLKRPVAAVNRPVATLNRVARVNKAPVKRMPTHYREIIQSKGTTLLRFYFSIFLYISSDPEEVLGNPLFY